MKKVYRFTASWCQPCKSLKMILDSIETDVYIETVDIDENYALASEFKVRNVPCMVMLEDDKEIKRMVGFKSKTEVTEWLNND